MCGRRKVMWDDRKEEHAKWKFGTQTSLNTVNTEWMADLVELFNGRDIKVSVMLRFEWVMNRKKESSPFVFSVIFIISLGGAEIIICNFFSSRKITLYSLISEYYFSIYKGMLMIITNIIYSVPIMGQVPCKPFQHYFI